MQPDIIIPATSGVDRYLSLLELECRRLASDQEVRDARAAQSSDVVVAAEVAAKGRVVRVFTSVSLAVVGRVLTVLTCKGRQR